MVSVGIIGNGFVGNATSHFLNDEIDVKIFDILPDKCNPRGLTLEGLCTSCDIFFICLPTPMSNDGSCHLGIIESVVDDMKNYIDLDKTPVVIRSTVPVGTSERLNCFFMPEFLTEANPVDDFRKTEKWIFGLKKMNFNQNKYVTEIVNRILTSNMKCGNIVTNSAYFVDTSEAESIKLFKNTFLAVKVGFCNEFYRFCQANSVDYKTVIKGVVTDRRITESHTRVPGNNNKFGFGGTCFPKDISSLQNQMKHHVVKSPIIDAVIERNNTIDRVEQDWKNDEGRAVINS